MVLIVTETFENGITYRISEDKETGFYLKESLQEPSQIEQEPDRIEQLEAENADLIARLGDVELALAELFTGGGA